MSKEARAMITASRHTKSHQFKAALDDALNQLNDVTKIIASAHHKSIRHVQNELYIGHGTLRSRCTKPNMWNAFCWKKSQDAVANDTLKSLVREHKDEYHRLSTEEQEMLLKEYVNRTDMKTFGMHISTKSKINDITQTLKAMENELNSLHCRTGAETILYTTRGSTYLPLRGVAFATEGIEHFMHSVMGIDNQDFVSKMEGFAIQGVKGATKNHQQRVSDARSAIRKIVTSGLREITGKPGANMQWAHYFRNIVEHYQVIIVGWPDNIPFVNLSKASSALPELQKLFDMCETGITHWKTLTDEEFAKLREECNAKLKRKKCERPTTTINDGNATRRKKYKSMETIEDSDKENDDADIGEDNGNDNDREMTHAPTPNLTFNNSSGATPDPTLSSTPADFTFKQFGSSAPPRQPSNATPDIGRSSELEPFNCDAALDMLD
ncbi:hypothetical protein BDR05DRAFT_1004606 [Suillus weaverae]|nr:hypothetical protein BDR05DRAFT_1004606 [Suillus weaverae]